MTLSGRMLAGAALILLGGCGDMSVPSRERTPGAEMTPGKWRFETEVVEMSSDKLSDSELDAMTNKPPIDERCIGSDETKRITDLFPKQGGDCTIEQDEIRDGLVTARSQCRSGDATADTRIDGSYSATSFEALSATKERGSTKSDGNITLTMRVEGKRIGDC